MEKKLSTVFHNLGSLEEVPLKWCALGRLLRNSATILTYLRKYIYSITPLIDYFDIQPQYLPSKECIFEPVALGQLWYSIQQLYLPTYQRKYLWSSTPLVDYSDIQQPLIAK